LILRVEKIGLSLEADEALLNSLVENARSHYPNEFGGFLIGYYNDDCTHLHITDTILPTSFKASKYSFQRDNIGINDELINFYNQNLQKVYVGEWHTHPDNSSIPSVKDISAINKIAISHNSRLANPVLLIIGFLKNYLEYGFYVFFNDKLYKYE